jgi:hypothetical protein
VNPTPIANLRHVPQSNPGFDFDNPIISLNFGLEMSGGDR